MEGGSIPIDPSSTTTDNPHDFLRDWNSTYQWITIVGGIVSFLLALFAGANDLPTSVSFISSLCCVLSFDLRGGHARAIFLCNVLIHKNASLIP